MPRVHLFELEDQPWFPIAWRDLLTDFLSFFFKTVRPYACAAPVLGAALERSGARRIVDLCSGAGEPVLSVLPGLERMELAPETITLTDKYPNLAAFRSAVERGGGLVSCVETPVDATDVPAELSGFRTLFTAFHHFEPGQARAILADAQRREEGVGVFEFTERNLLLWTLPVLLIPLFVLVCTPFIRPFSWRRLLWTYLVPMVPLVALWDGMVSNLRSYSIEELEALTVGLDEPWYCWQAGRIPSVGLSRVTYLVGWPNGSRRSGS